MNGIGLAAHLSVSGIVTDADVWNLSRAPEFSYAFQGCNLVWKRLQHDPGSGKRLNSGNRRVGVVESERMELLAGLSEMQDDVTQRHQVAKLQAALDLVERSLSLDRAHGEDVFSGPLEGKVK